MGKNLEEIGAAVGNSCPRNYAGLLCSAHPLQQAASQGFLELLAVGHHRITAHRLMLQPSKSVAL